MTKTAIGKCIKKWPKVEDFDNFITVQNALSENYYKMLIKNLSHFTCRLLGYSYPNASFIRIQQPLDPLLKKLDLKTQRKYEAFL